MLSPVRLAPLNLPSASWPAYLFLVQQPQTAFVLVVFLISCLGKQPMAAPPEIPHGLLFSLRSMIKSPFLFLYLFASSCRDLEDPPISFSPAIGPWHLYQLIKNQMGSRTLASEPPHTDCLCIIQMLISVMAESWMKTGLWYGSHNYIIFCKHSLSSSDWLIKKQMVYNKAGSRKWDFWEEIGSPGQN